MWLRGGLRQSGAGPGGSHPRPEDLNALNGAILIVLGRVAADPDRAFADRRSGLGEELSNHAEKGERAIRLREIGRRPGILRPLLVAT